MADGDEHAVGGPLGDRAGLDVLEPRTIHLQRAGRAPVTSSSTESQTTSIFGCLNSRSWKIFSARKWSRRCTTVTLEAKLVRNSASSTAVLPLPMTKTSLLR